MSHELYAAFHTEGLSSEAMFVYAIAAGISLAKEKIFANYEQNPNPDNNLAYHRLWHTNAVIRRTDTLMEAAQNVDPSITDRDILLARFVAAFHDTYQRSDEESVITENGSMIKRKRHTGQNEEESYQFAYEYMHVVNIAAGEEIFTEEDFTTVKEAILLTVPGFDKKLETVIHPEFSRSGLIAQVIALADLGGSGMDGGKEAVYEAVALYKEDNMDLLYADHREGRREGRLGDKQREEQFRLRLIDWLTAQQKFIYGQEIVTAKDIKTMSHDIQSAIADCFHAENYAQAHQELDILLQEIQSSQEFDKWRSICDSILLYPSSGNL